MHIEAPSSFRKGWDLFNKKFWFYSLIKQKTKIKIVKSKKYFGGSDLTNVSSDSILAICKEF